MLDSPECNTNAKVLAQTLMDFDTAPVSLALYHLARMPYDRIVLTGVGKSHFSALPSWRRLIAAGKAAWWVNAGRLLDRPTLLTSGSLLIVTSQSGAGGEVVTLAEKFYETTVPAAIIAITEDRASPLAVSADCEILLRSRTGTSDGFLNSLAAHDYLTSMLLGEPGDDVALTARIVAATSGPEVLDAVASDVVADARARLAYIGFRDHVATALYAGLLTKESTRVVAEGYLGSEFLHGPLRRADDHLTAVLFGGRQSAGDQQLQGLAARLAAAGSKVVVVGDTDVAGAIAIPVPAAHLSGQLAHGVVIANHLVEALRRPTR